MSDDHGYHHGPHDWSHGAPHNSWAPLIMSIGAGLFLFGFAKTFTMNDGMNGYIFDSRAAADDYHRISDYVRRPDYLVEAGHEFRRFVRATGYRRQRSIR